MKRKKLVVAIVLIVGLTVSFVAPVYVDAVLDLWNESIVLDMTKPNDAPPVRDVGESDSSSEFQLSGSTVAPDS